MPRDLAQPTILARCSTGQHPTGRVGRRVDPQQRDPLGSERRQRIGPDGRCTGHDRADLVRRVGQLGNHDHITGPQAELGGQRRDQFLGTDGRQHVHRVEVGHPVSAAQPLAVGLPDRGGAMHHRVAGGLGGIAEGGAHRQRHPVDRGADGQVDQAVGMLRGRRPGRQQAVPREVGQPADRRAAGPAARRRALVDGLLVQRGRLTFVGPGGVPAGPVVIGRGQFSSPIGGSAATSGSSLPVLPTLEAPPGDPSSSKKSTFARV